MSTLSASLSGSQHEDNPAAAVGLVLNLRPPRIHTSPQRPGTAPTPAPGWSSSVLDLPSRPAPLFLTHPAYDPRSIPQRSFVNDLRLAPSQRPRSCYSPQFLGIAGVASNLQTPRAVTPGSPYGKRSPNSPPANYAHRMPSDETKAILDHSNLWKDRRWYSPTRAQSPPSNVKKVNTVLRKSTVLSTMLNEASPAPAREGHFPTLTEKQQRVFQQLSFEKGPGLPFKKRVKEWGLRS